MTGIFSLRARALASKVLIHFEIRARWTFADKISLMNRERQSRSANIARERERQRIAALSAVERALLALRLGRRARMYMALAGRK